MSQFTDTLFTLRGRVLNSRPEVTPDFVAGALNDRMRQILDNRTFWADLLQFGILSFPAPTTAGTMSTVTGSASVSGAATFWPVADVVNTTIPEGVPEFGYVEVAPASMQGITANSMLYVDAADTPEVVPVVEVGRTTFIAKFSKIHNMACTVTQSSLANQQFRPGESYPIFTVAAVTYLDPAGSGNGTLVLTLPWGGPPLTNAVYTIKLMYVTIGSDVKAIIAMKDEETGYPVRLHVALQDADFRDPQRTIVTGNPWFSLVDLGANAQGNALFEMWPGPSDQRQFSYAYWKQWPDMTHDTDRPPPFINPSILYYGALADAKMMRVRKDDPYYDPVGARHYEQKFMQGLQEAKNADEAKVLSAMKNPWWRGIAGNYDTWQLNDPAIAGFFGGLSW